MHRKINTINEVAFEEMWKTQFDNQANYSNLLFN